ncbi:DUF3347 domain-containing protein [Antarcticibacterium flavum]|uniref:DUF3347 domain-containing protein n=1 Tax=Antarcticibacterium flavum TaxID=2058175 RepID=A0A5B7X4S2_9FLAO|nr:MULTISPECIES: DUF3347 domain-containing protein [Antarcticibacterium]MCM4158499.1 hypothetical protein [Antarcticibacterium sp. W02-3]QCY70250.1 DUF3347 domain-containing protein [Antarcticibacterium flavum]
MRNLRVNLGIAILTFATLTTISCRDTNEGGDMDHSEMNHENMNEGSEMMDGENMMEGSGMMEGESENSQTGRIVNDYLQLKDALVADNVEEAAKAGGSLVAAFDGFNMSEYNETQKQELTEIIEDAKEHAEHITMSDIAHQREHFDILSVDLADMLEITGSPKTLYQQFCPMYNDNKGAIWLSASEEIRNPYYGQKMLKCGEVQKEI